MHKKRHISIKQHYECVQFCEQLLIYLFTQVLVLAEVQFSLYPVFATTMQSAKRLKQQNLSYFCSKNSAAGDKTGE